MVAPEQQTGEHETEAHNEAKPACAAFFAYAKGSQPDAEDDTDATDHSQREPQHGLASLYCGAVRVTRAELESVRRSQPRRRLIRVLRCPPSVKVGARHRLHIDHDSEIITILSVDEQRVDALTLGQAKAEGFFSVESAQEDWEKTHGVHEPHRSVWAIGFLRGDHTETFKRQQPTFLAPSGRAGEGATGYTTAGDALNAGEVPRDKDLDKKLANARQEQMRALRLGIARRRILDQAEELETLAEAMTSMKARNGLRRVARAARCVERSVAAEQLAHP